LMDRTMSSPFASFPFTHSNPHHDFPGPEDLPGAVTWQRQRHAIVH
jgi:hypothetical protein